MIIVIIGRLITLPLRVFFSVLLMHRVNRFARSGKRNAWIFTWPVKIYLRKSWRRIDLRMPRYSLDLASIEVNYKWRGIGLGNCARLVIENVAKTYDFDGVYIENVFENRFGDFFKRKGYIAVNQNYSGPSCYWKNVK